MGGQGLHPQGLGGSENLGASETETSTTESVDIGSTADIGKGSKPLISNSSTTLFVDPTGDDSNDGSSGSPLATIQEAVDRCPYLLRHDFIINVNAGTYNEDVRIQGITCSNDDTSGFSSLVIQGDTGTPSNVEVDSITVLGTSGMNAPYIKGVKILDVSPTADPAGIAAYGSQTVLIEDVAYGSTATSNDVGVLFYGGTTGAVRNTQDFSDGGRDFAFIAKRSGSMMIRSATVSGSVDDHVINAVSGQVYLDKADISGISSTNSTFNSGPQGFVYNGGDGEFASGLDLLNPGTLQFNDLDYLDYSLSASATGGNTLSLNIPNLSSGSTKTEFVIELYYSDGGTQQDLHCRMNGDGASSGDYRYTDISGAESTGQNNIVLHTQSSNFVVAKYTLIVSRSFDGALSVRDAVIRGARGTRVAEYGNRDANETLTSVEFIPTAGSDADLSARVFSKTLP